MKDIPYLALMDELWEVFREIFDENDRDISRAYTDRYLATRHPVQDWRKRHATYAFVRQ